ncbi:MAG: 50S ribosomal protein L21e [DPANN group archaeon]|nr:50S ribosomal protein L21e [DPANN group archaeon]
MVQRAGGFRARTRRTLSRSPRSRGKISLTRLMQQFKEGDRVMIDIESAVHKGMPHPRYEGRAGVVVGMQGRVYRVAIMDGGIRKIFLSNAVHLRKL